MILYHGSKEKFSTLHRKQAQAGDGVIVPESELQNGIYLTPDYGFAIAVASIPPMSSAHIDEKEKTITYEHPENFDPEREIYVYTIDTNDFPETHFSFLDELQYVVTDTDELHVAQSDVHKAIEVLQYFKITNWDRPEHTAEQNAHFKIH